MVDEPHFPYLSPIKLFPFERLAVKKHACPNASQLHDILSAVPHPLSLDDILRYARLSHSLKRDILATLQRMADQGDAVRLRGGAWTLISRLKRVTGILEIQRSGAAFVTPQGKRRASERDISIAPDGIADAWNGDLVEVQIFPARKGYPAEGRVLRVIRRGLTELALRVGRPASGKKQVLGRPADFRLNFDMLVDVSALPAAPEKGDLLQVAPGERLPSPSGIPLWAGTALALLGKEDETHAQELLTKLNHRIPTSFPDNVRAEAERVSRATYKCDNCTDLRNLPLVTIDGENARDFDDAVYVEPLDSGWRLLVAIADVSLYVSPHSVLDREAYERGNSYYFPTSVEPMLPETLSNGVCSLRPGEDRRVLTVDLQLDAGAHLTRSSFYAAVMRSRARLTYEQAQAFLDGDKNSAIRELPDIAAMLTSAAALATQLTARRQKQGELELEIPEAEFVTDHSHVTEVLHRKRLFSHKLIEVFMITANEAVAEFLVQKGQPFLYRVHPEPSHSKIENLIQALKATNLVNPPPRRGEFRANPQRQFRTILESAEGSTQAFLVNRLILRSMMQARYTPEAGGHFGLASTCYCHFTSPIRRYADLINHRALRHSLGLAPGELPPLADKLPFVAEQCNSRERAAQDAEREITRRMGCLLLQDRKGEIFRGVISGVMPFGLFIELENIPLEGMIRVEQLGADYFDYDAERQELRGRTGSAAYRLGDLLEVRLAEVSLERLEINFELPDFPSRGSSLHPRRRKAVASKRSSPISGFPAQRTSSSSTGRKRERPLPPRRSRKTS